MAPLLSLLTALLVFSYGPGGTLGCDLSQDHVRVNKENIALLHQMQRISSFRCRKDRKNFGLPREMVDGSQVQEAQAISVLHEMLQETSDIFGSEHSSTAWNTTLQHGLLSGGAKENLQRVRRWSSQGTYNSTEEEGSLERIEKENKALENFTR